MYYPTKFVEIGCDIQRTVKTAGQAVKQMEKTCNICASHGIRLECETCPIWATHKMIMEQKFGRKIKDQD